MNPLRGWTVDREQITFAGHDLQRPSAFWPSPTGPCGARTRAAG